MHMLHISDIIIVVSSKESRKPQTAPEHRMAQYNRWQSSQGYGWDKTRHSVSHHSHLHPGTVGQPAQHGSCVMALPIHPSNLRAPSPQQHQWHRPLRHSVEGRRRLFCCHHACRQTMCTEFVLNGADPGKACKPYQIYEESWTCQSTLDHHDQNVLGEQGHSSCPRTLASGDDQASTDFQPHAQCNQVCSFAK